MSTTRAYKGITSFQLLLTIEGGSIFHIGKNYKRGIRNVTTVIKDNVHRSIFRSVSTSSQLPRDESYDAVIVGGGHNGLVAAAYLAKTGVK